MHSPYSIPPELLEHAHGVPVFEQGQPITEADLNSLALDWRLDWLVDRVAGEKSGPNGGVALDVDKQAFTWKPEGKNVRILKGDYWLKGIVVSSKEDVLLENAPNQHYLSLEATELFLPAISLAPGLKRHSFSGRKVTVWNLWTSPNRTTQIPTECRLQFKVDRPKPKEANTQGQAKSLIPETLIARIEVHRSGQPDKQNPSPLMFKWASAWQAPIVQLEKENEREYRGGPQSADLSWIVPGSYLELIEPVDSRQGNLESKQPLLKVESYNGTVLTVSQEFPGWTSTNDTLIHRSPAPHLASHAYRVWNGVFTGNSQPPQFELRFQNYPDPFQLSFTFNPRAYHRGDSWMFAVTRLSADRFHVETPKEVIEGKGEFDKPIAVPQAGGWKVVELGQISFDAAPAHVPAEAESPRSQTQQCEVIKQELPLSSLGQSRPQPLLSDAGVSALKRYFNTPKEILRRIPARYLNLSLSYSPLISWLAPALVSDIVDLSFDEFADEYQQVHHVEKRDWPLFEREAREVLAQAKTFSQRLATNDGIQSLLG